MADGISPVAMGAFVLFFVWLVVVTYFVLQIRSHYDKLIKTGGKKGLQEVFDHVIRTVEKDKKNVSELEDRLAKEERKNEFVIQKLSLLRFNPFSNTGGEQSFTLTLLDKHDNGILITALSGRTGTRWYAKRLKRGRGVDFELSKEEEEAISSAKPLG